MVIKFIPASREVLIDTKERDAKLLSTLNRVIERLDRLERHLTEMTDLELEGDDICS